MSVLIHIGYPKAGSTFFQHWLHQHPDIHFQADFLSTYSATGVIPNKTIPDLKEKKHFAISEEQLVLWQGKIDLVGMKFSPFDIKTQQKKVAEDLFKSFPQAKVLIVTRGFQSMLQSIYSQYVSMGGILTFEGYQKQMGPHLAQFYDYRYVINLYRTIFKNENVLVLPFEMLKDNAEGFIGLICNQTNVEVNTAFKYLKTNPSIDRKLFAAYRFTSNALYIFIKLFPRSLRLKIYLKYVNDLSEKKLDGLMTTLSKFIAPSPFEINREILELFGGKAQVLSSEKLFQPYLKEYLL